MDCSEAKPQLTALVSGRLSPDDEAELRTHLETCEECSLEVKLLQGRSAPSPAAPEPKPEPLLKVAPLAPPHSDWTVEKIFGDGGASGAAPPGDAVASPAAPSARPSPLFAAEEPTAIPAIAAETAPPKPSSAAKPAPDAWDFELADAARDATPPEESLLFAEQALNRRIDDPSRKGAALRAILWSGGAVAGVALLGVSLWMAMAVHRAPPREIAARVKNSTAPTSEAKPPMPDPPEKPEAPTLDASASNPETGEAAPSALPAQTPPASSAAAPAPIKSSLAPKSPPAAPPSAPAGAKASAPKPTLPPASKSADATAPAAVVKSGATSVATKDPPPAAKPAAAASGPAAATPPAASAKRDDDDMWPTDDPVHATPAAPKSAAPPKQAAGSAPETQRSVSAAETATPAAPETPRVDLKPIDRIHAATDQAAKDQDLLALRELKTTWKNLLRTVVGPDRSRAKRELADCLWVIQALSGRIADQRETLLAYRDYLLSAPAGGADARSAARLRELEDAISERR
ncbi:MAG: zf-HC2 domain-containing protein [Candidatus Eisenbacteria bacterium]